MRSLRAWLADIANAILGDRCRLGCGQRVFTRDIGWHEDLNHDGDTL